MKKYISTLILLFAINLGFTACSSDDNDSTVSGLSQIIIGEWDSEFLGEASDVDINNLNVNDTQLTTVDSHLVFNSNGSGTETDKWTGEKQNFSYTVKDNILKMSAGGISQTHRILKYGDKVVYSLMESENSVFKMVKIK